MWCYFLPFILTWHPWSRLAWKQVKLLTWQTPLLTVWDMVLHLVLLPKRWRLLLIETCYTLFMFFITFILFVYNYVFIYECFLSDRWWLTPEIFCTEYIIIDKKAALWMAKEQVSWFKNSPGARQTRIYTHDDFIDPLSRDKNNKGLTKKWIPRKFMEFLKYLCFLKTPWTKPLGISYQSLLIFWIRVIR